MDPTTTEITLGYSFCPNDTYIFRALTEGEVPLPGFHVRTELHDVETLNELAMAQALDVTKLSFFAWLKVKDHYRLLDTGAAMGYGCGPILVTDRPLKPADLARCRVVLPGRWTTACLLFQLWAPTPVERIYATYDQVLPLVRAGEADCGVIIHENRFTYEQAGFHAMVDLGSWWEQQTGLPIPLGCIAARRSLPQATIRAIESAVGQSLQTARDDPQRCLTYMRAHAQEMDPHVLWRHVHTFVNDFSSRLGAKGQAAIDALEARALQAGVLP